MSKIIVNNNRGKWRLHKRTIRTKYDVRSAGLAYFIFFFPEISVVNDSCLSSGAIYFRCHVRNHRTSAQSITLGFIFVYTKFMHNMQAGFLLPLYFSLTSNYVFFPLWFLVSVQRNDIEVGSADFTICWFLLRFICLGAVRTSALQNLLISISAE